MIRRPPRSTLSSSSAASDVYKRQFGAYAVCRRPHGGVWPLRTIPLRFGAQRQELQLPVHKQVLTRHKTFTAHTSHLLTHIKDRLCSHRLQARKRQCAGASYFFIFMRLSNPIVFFTDDFIGSKFVAGQHASCSYSELQNVRNFAASFVQFSFLSHSWAVFCLRIS